MDKTKDFEILVENLLFTYRQRCLNEVIHEKVGGEFYIEFSFTWNTILLSLEAGYLLGLERILEKKEFKKIISIYPEFKEVREKVKTLRDDFFAHLNIRKMRNPENFWKENALNRDTEVQNLFNKMLSFILQYNKNLGYTENLQQLFNEIRKETQSECDTWLQSLK